MPSEHTADSVSNVSTNSLPKEGIRSRTSSIQQEIKQQHSFHIATFSKPTYCDLCSNFIWGMVKQGFSCSDCGYNAHKKCQSLVMTTCNPVHYHAPRKSTDAPRKSVDSKKGNIVTELFAETQVQSRKLENALSEANPALNMATFMKQNNRFTARQTPLIWMNETIVKLLTWHSVPNTLMFLLCYTLVCLHPILIPILPQLGLLYLMIRFYHYRADNIMNGHPLPKPHIIGQPPKLSPNAAELKAAFQNIQNTMAKVSDAYDAGYNLYRMIDWSDPQLTQDILVKTVVSMFITLLVVTLIPLNYLALAGGVGVFIANTAIFKAASVTLAPVLVQKLQRRVDRVRQLVKEARESGTEAVIDVIVFENQRWWAGAGWISSLLQHERNSWSDESGSVSMPPKDDFPIPTVAELTELDGENQNGKLVWVEEDWELDLKWTEVDQDGWEYSNQNWDNPRPSRVLGSFTRRRKWLRHLKLVETK